MLKYLSFIFVFLLSSVLADDIIDSTDIPIIPDSTDIPIISDTTEIPIIIDTAFVDSLYLDSLGIDQDTLTEGQRAYQLFLGRQARRKEFQIDEIKEVKTYLSFYDSLVVAFLHPRLSSTSEITKSFAKDAGDFFKADPSYFIRNYQQTPLRKTVSPFGLSGDRMNIISNGLVLAPFEHIPEPDGQVDFNDIPTGLTKESYILPGGIGQLFGGTQSIATLVTVPNRPESFEPEIKLQLDKGDFDYAYTRGGYTKLFSDGKEIDLSTDYRNTFGIRTNTDDNGKNFAGRTLIPLKSSYYLTASGSSYRRRGSYKPVLLVGTPFITRSRTDRNGKIALEKFNDDQTVKYHVGYGYLKQNSNIDIAYKGRFNFFGNEIVFARESLLGNNMFKSEISYSFLKQTDGLNNDSEKSGKASLALFQKKEYSSLGITAGTIYNEDYKFLPFSSVVYQNYSDKHFMMFSVGYSEKAPSMHGQNLILQHADMYATGVGYADVGNKWLLSEKQLIGSFMYEHGSLKSNLRLSVTGGIINDGIDWYHTDTLINAISIKLFSPQNADINFADFQLKQKLAVGDILNFSLGGAYHFIDNEFRETKPFQPEYQIFFGGELHHYWKQKLMDLYAYGETVYVGPYTGYSDQDLGDNVMVNTGLAFEIKKFRFYYIFQNSISLRRSTIDGFNNLGQFSYYGITWYFLN